jgi:hypothetical protein
VVPPQGQPVGWLQQQVEKVRSFRKLPQNWDSYGAEPPSPAAVFWAEEVLETVSLKGYQSGWVEPSAEGGVMIAFRRGTDFGSIECYNSGSIVAVLSDGHGTIDARTVAPTARSLEDAVSQVGEHIHG